MKRNRIMTAVVLGAILLSLTVPTLAAVATKTITIETDVKVLVNNKALDAGDTHGNPDCFIYNGTTYVAVAAVSKSLGQSVGWAGETRTVHITTPKEEITPADTKSRYGVGEKVAMKDVVVTLKSVKENTGANFMEPEDGNVYLICEFDIENNSKEEISVSSLLSFEGYVDDYATSLSLGGVVASGKETLDGDVAAGKKINGVIAYEVPESWAELEIHFTPDIWNDSDITFVATKK